MSRASELADVWNASSLEAPYSYAVSPSEFEDRIRPVDDDDESYATSKSQTLLVATSGSAPVGFAHLCSADAIEVDGEVIACGVIRSMAFFPDREDVGRTLLDESERTFRGDGHDHVDAYPLYYGYAFHNYKVGLLSDRLTHITQVLRTCNYEPHDPQLTMERPISEEPLPQPRSDIDILVERTEGSGSRIDIQVRGLIDGERIGAVRTMSGYRYAQQAVLHDCGYTRWVGVSEKNRRKGIARHLLKRALHELDQEGYTVGRLNVREKNRIAYDLYLSEGYAVGDRSAAYVKDLGA